LRKARIKSKVVWDDARVLKQGRIRSNGRLDKGRSAPIPNNSIGLVITSPPYINAQKYVRTTKFEIFWLGMADEHELTHLSKSTIGTEAVYCQQYKDLTLTGVASADRVIEKIYKIDRQKAFIVAKYFLDMETVFREVHRVLRPGGRFVVVIGDNSVRGVKVENHRILRDIACQDGLFREETVLVDEIRSRGMITKRHETGGLLLDEWVIVLRKEG
jgi:DNA modification methylase